VIVIDFDTNGQNSKILPESTAGGTAARAKETKKILTADPAIFSRANETLAL
jgi:hypothetical protein